MAAVKLDQRREAGMRTRARLLEAALDLLAERGEDGVSLRDITNAAEANVAAVSYHFGSLKALCDAAVEQGLVGYLEAQQAAVATLSYRSSLEELAGALARAVIRVGACAARARPEGWERSDESSDRTRADVLRVLRATAPAVRDRELTF